MEEFGAKAFAQFIGRENLEDRCDPTAGWIDPRTGDRMPAGEFDAPGKQSFTTPAGWEDALLVIQPAGR